MSDAVNDRERTKRVSEARQAMNSTYAGYMPGKITLSKILKVCEDIEENMPEKIIKRIEVSHETAILIRHNYKKGMFYGTPIYVKPELKVPYKIIYEETKKCLKKKAV